LNTTVESGARPGGTGIAARPPRIENIEAGRGLAAAIVVFYHIDKYYFGSAKYWPETFLNGFMGFGHAGVEFFFVLSGLIITSIHFGDIGMPNRVGSFFKKRFARVLPFYWLCLAIMIAELLLAPSGSGNRLNATSIIASILLFGADPHVAILFVGWTLFHELLFYVLFGLAIWRPRIGLPILGAWLLGALLSAFIPDVPAYPFGLINLLFGFGIVAGLLLRRPRIPMPALLAIAGGALFFMTGFAETEWGMATRSAQILGYGVGATLALVGMVSLERQRGIKPPRLLTLTGEASYSIYLTHMLVLPPLAMVALAVGAPRHVPAPMAFVGFAVITIAVGIVVHLVVERRLVRWVRGRLGMR
jgi:exopolysaccharide production protein ExoZ